MNHMQCNCFLYWFISTNRIFQKMSGAFNCVKYGVPKIGLQCADQNFATKSVHV